MKTLIVYYSRTGHNETLARILQKKLDQSEIEEVVDHKNREGNWGIFVSIIDAAFHRLTKIEVPRFDAKDFDLIVIVTPLWAGSLPPATRTYLTMNRENIKKYAFISVSDQGKENRRAVADLEKTAHQSPSPVLLLNEKEYAGGAKTEIEEFILNLA